MSKFAIEITEEVTFSNASYGNAAMLTSHKLIPGVYPFEVERNQFGTVLGVVAHIDNLLMAKSYNGVPQGNFTPGQPDKLRHSMYDYEMKDDKALIYNGQYFGTIRQIEA